MLSALQQRKLTTLFKNLDADNGGILTEEDFRLVLDKLATSRGIKANSLQYAYLRTILLSLWKKVSLADENSDAKVTLEEWLKYYENLIKCGVIWIGTRKRDAILFKMKRAESGWGDAFVAMTPNCQETFFSVLAKDVSAMSKIC